MDVAETHQRLIGSRIEMMRDYAETTGTGDGAAELASTDREFTR